ncbi:unnamed protein product [Spirodela intermedia]|uniref:Chalcone-flavonone isomerase family protein n=1 Tax=Spirodela intermedia TaxID=51605 RepID=A0A7I8JGH2_SPIIN|nr:unnamed protein product [Spirodela intermedia]CAA6669240.1 unnamed protein product [Spirodela intermedia]
MVDEIAFPSVNADPKPLALLGYGITDIEIHFLQIKFTAIGVYADKEIVGHLGKWKGKKGSDLKEDDDFFDALVSAPVAKQLRIVVIKEIKGSQYGLQLETAEEEALEKVINFLQSKYFMKNSVITISFPAAPAPAEISFSTEGKEETKIQVENANVAEMLQKWYLGGSSALSPSTVASLAENLGELLSQ